MTYTKPHNVTYTQMAMWIDANSRKKDCDTARMHEYLYHLCHMLARKRNYFDKSDVYDRFSLYCANNYLVRLMQNENGRHVEYILKYIKTSIGVWKIKFKNFEQPPIPEDFAVIPMESDRYTVDISDNGNQIDAIAFALSLDSIDTTIRRYLMSIPMKRDSSEWTNIYISCLLTMLDGVTPTEYQRKMMSNKKGESFYKVYDLMKNQPPKMFHLNKSMETYIKVLVNEIRKLLAEELRWRTNSSYSTDSTMMGIVFTSKEEAQK